MPLGPSSNPSVLNIRIRIALAAGRVVPENAELSSCIPGEMSRSDDETSENPLLQIRSRIDCKKTGVQTNYIVL
jgi:hypothetical protein